MSPLVLSILRTVVGAPGEPASAEMLRISELLGFQQVTRNATLYGRQPLIPKISTHTKSMNALGQTMTQQAAASLEHLILPSPSFHSETNHVAVSDQNCEN